MGPKRASSGFLGEAHEPGLDISNIGQMWDGDEVVRMRLREGGALLHPQSGLACDNRCCCLNKEVLVPILFGMASNAERKLPSIGDLRNEMAICFRLNKRMGPDVQASVAGDAIQLRKLLSFVKGKVRRQEVSTALQLHFEQQIWDVSLHNCVFLKPS